MLTILSISYAAETNSLQQIRIATQEDDELPLLRHTIIEGWPSTIKEVPSVLHLYWTFREELNMCNGMCLGLPFLPSWKCPLWVSLLRVIAIAQLIRCMFRHSCQNRSWHHQSIMWWWLASYSDVPWQKDFGWQHLHQYDIYISTVRV